jgi:hypothetical protein
LLQVGFKRDLVKEVQAFVQDAQTFRRDWEANGPMVPGLEPMEAVDRLKKFQQMFEVSTGTWVLTPPGIGPVDGFCLCNSASLSDLHITLASTTVLCSRNTTGYAASSELCG